ncbi:c-type cytochrome [Fuerstiella marisgermanici]|uniref:Auracyanin-A n=1 Tax=Fuerstiella marisgermanici TaxID=1891926 RepID=A0A1P8WMX7_9PLAN|nr:c-type cytochrome [Fuerstiella marisgermanici]APZ95415.1 Auracyanin-A precursor [Fuerstiella marisgermanici]
MSRFLFIPLILTAVAPTIAQDHAHHHHGDGEAEVERPKILLDKSARIVEYQLKRLDNAKLLLVETATDDPKYLPVFKAILLRPGLSLQNREAALDGLTAINKSDSATELLAVLGTLSDSDKDQQRVGRQLSAILLNQPAEVLKTKVADLNKATTQESSVLRATGYAGLIVAGQPDDAWDQAKQNESARLDYLAAVSLVPQGPLRNSLRDNVVASLDDAQPKAVRVAAIRALATISDQQPDSFQRLADFVPNVDFRTPAVRSLLKLPPEARDEATSRTLVKILVQHAEDTPAAKRTSDEFVDAMQLADELLRKLPSEESRSYRDRLRAVTVRVVRIHTVEEEMRYDRPFFAVEAGRPVQVILENEDLMPHNMVITKPGQLKAVALAGAELGTAPGLDGKLYVPESPDVLYSTDMVNAGQRFVLTFTAPTEPGEYPYVCTFPRHWMRMYGVMVVVPDLDAWQRNPVEPKDPLGNNRSFVQNWKLSDFPADQLADAMRGRNPDIGARLFKEATCLGCHKINGQGGSVGPDMKDLMKRWKGNHHGILREILEPSYKIDPKYAVKIVVDIDGRTTSGIVQAEDKKSISILVNPEVPEPKVILKDDIEEIIPSTTSMMPKALLDKFSREEIMEILAYITAAEE